LRLVLENLPFRLQYSIINHQELSQKYLDKEMSLTIRCDDDDDRPRVQHDSSPVRWTGPVWLAEQNHYLKHNIVIGGLTKKAELVRKPKQELSILVCHTD
jgi:hypothetical protein